MATATASDQKGTDERVSSSSTLAKVLKRPESGALVAAVAVFFFFAVNSSIFASFAGASNWLYTSSTIGIMAVAVALLMIGGEFDLSAGAMTGFTGLAVGILTTQYGLNVWAAILVSLLLALAIGAINGLLVMRTGLPSFIVTLGTFFVLQGVNLAGTKALIGQVSIQGLGLVPFFDQPKALFGHVFEFPDINLGLFVLHTGNLNLKVSVLWWLAVTAVATWVLLRTKAGNWIFSVGGAQNSARQIGVPVLGTKVGLFMTTAGAGWLVGMILLFNVSTVQATTGIGQEFIYIICAVVGGCLLTGGYGSAVGAAFGALIYGMTYQGIVFTGWDNNWLKAFLGVMLLGAVLLNEWVRKRAEMAR